MLTEQQRTDIVNTVAGWFQQEPPAVQADFKKCTEDELIRYHHGLGTAIRNEFHLWEHPWEPEIVDGFDMSPNHPDAISMSIIVDVWKKVRDA